MVDKQQHSCQNSLKKILQFSTSFKMKKLTFNQDLTSLILVFICGILFAFLSTQVQHVNLFLKKPSRLRPTDVSKLFSSDEIYNPLHANLPVKRRENEKKAEDRSSEAEAALHLAQDMAAHNKIEKALKLFQHALALMPGHPDVLTGYGEFLEKHKLDIVAAEHMYSQALTHSPEHDRALANRKRTLPLVEEIDQTNFNMVDKKRDLLIKIPESHPGLRRMKQESYYSHIHHTTALEGNTFTLGQTRSLVESGLAVGGKSVIEHNEILGLDSALSFVNSTLVQRIGAITLQDILDIHRRVLGHVDPLEAGKIRNTQVFVSDFVPPDASEVAKLLDEFVEWLNSEDALSLHPIEHSALAHYRFVIIHPFYDGNGRTSRLLMNLILMQAGYPPVTIRKEEKYDYYQYLDTANKGDVRPFIRFIAKCTDRTLNEYLRATTEITELSNVDISIPRFFEDDGRTIVLEEPDINTKGEL